MLKVVFVATPQKVRESLPHTIPHVDRDDAVVDILHKTEWTDMYRQNINTLRMIRQVRAWRRDLISRDAECSRIMNHLHSSK